MQANCMSGSMRRGEKRVMVHSANGHRTRKGGNGGAPPDLYTTALALYSTLLTAIEAAYDDPRRHVTSWKTLGCLAGLVMRSRRRDSHQQAA